MEESKKKFKLIFFLALIGTLTGTVGLILGSVSVHKSAKLNYYLNPDGEAIWGSSIIWQHNYNSVSLYFAWKKISFNDIEWNGIYPENYFNK
ncbi:hypothetical protein LT336_00759 [Spiroplasma sp. JKS002671]|uniref:hypothetical protein n=1 Tax=Spiroplasma attinicola TaxID=2904537 RepID=UPI002022B00A|nr:hypothetical protein [Spiroplasma sp. JKS002671]MCL8211007.1 hypothetical protein [Spiroplasma sp. JKS002671]